MFGAGWSEWTADDLRLVQCPIDFLGINYYLRLVMRDAPEGGPARAVAVVDPNCPRTACDWEIYPEGMLEILEWVKTRYGNLPLYITENGAAFDDAVEPNCTIDDGKRVQYLNEHLRTALRAIRSGIDLRGYFLWSLLDNFEWQSGYSKCFGIVHVDFKTQRRTPKASAKFYSNVIRTKGASLDDPQPILTV